MFRDGVALAGDQRRSNRPHIAGEHRANPKVDGVAQSLNVGVGAQAPSRLDRRRNDLDRAMDETGGAEPLEIKIAGEIVAAGAERL